MNLSLIEIVDYSATQVYRFEDNFDTREQAIKVILRENLIRNDLGTLTQGMVFAAMRRDILEDIEVWEDSPVYGDPDLTIIQE